MKYIQIFRGRKDGVEAAGYSSVRGWVHVDPVTGENSFRRDPAGNHEYLVKIHPDAYYAAQINAVL